MTRNDHIDILRAIRWEIDNGRGGDFLPEQTARQLEALDSAIYALGTIEQLRWERDIALGQLEGLGYGLGEEPRTARWERHPVKKNREWDVCSACKIGTKRREYGTNPDGTEYVTEYSYSYCPYCGRKME